MGLGLQRAAAVAGAAGLVAGALARDWPQFGRGPERVATTTEPVSGLSVRWVSAEASPGEPAAFSGQGGVVTDGVRVYGVARVSGAWRVMAIACADGAVEWSRPVPAPYVDSWSTPALDAGHGTVLVAAGRLVSAFDAASGDPRWQATLARHVVNASPLVTGDRGPADRAFITDYDGTGVAARLYCMNIDPFTAGANPYQPGEIVWSVPIGGSSGNTPAYDGGVVYVASVTNETGFGPGRVMAFDAGASAPPPARWTTENPAGFPFFGGVSVRAGAVYAASYAFSGGQRAANLLKLDAATGGVRWSVACNRTASTPVPLGDGRVLVSGGIPGFGSVPSLELFRDDGSSAAMLWDSALDTWQDLNQNGLMERGEYLLVGGWTHLPVHAAGRLYAGAIGDGTTTFSACTDLYAIDLSRAPGQPGFIVEHLSGMGATPAAADGSLYSIGGAGLFALGGCYANCDGSSGTTPLNVNDFVCFQARFAAGDPWANCDGSTGTPTLNVNDLVCFQARFAGGCP